MPPDMYCCVLLCIAQMSMLWYNVPMIGKNKSTLLDKALSAKLSAEKKLQAYGRRIRANYEQGRKDWKSGKMKNYGTINLFK